MRLWVPSRLPSLGVCCDCWALLPTAETLGLLWNHACFRRASQISLVVRNDMTLKPSAVCLTCRCSACAKVKLPSKHSLLPKWSPTCRSVSMKILHSSINSASGIHKLHLQTASELLGSWEYPHGINSEQKHAGLRKALLFTPLNLGCTKMDRQYSDVPSPKRYLQSHP